MTDPARFDLQDLRFNESTTAFLFEGEKRAGTGTSMFVVRTPPGGSVELHTHPYAETFLLLEGEGRWTAGDAVVDATRDRLSGGCHASRRLRRSCLADGS
jgi:mannose-6-phosphate isomerase-like protein (cupin superfamily)